VIKRKLLRAWLITKKILYVKSIILRVLLLLLAILIIALQSTQVQTWLGRIATDKLSVALNFPISVKQIEIQWLDQIRLKKVQILDRQNNNMIFVDGLTLNYHLQQLLQEGNIFVEYAEVDSANVNLIDLPDSLGGMNIDQFIEAIDNSPADTTKKTNKGMQFIVGEIDLKRSFFSFHKPYADSLKGQFDYNHFALNNLQAQVKQLTIVRDTVMMGMKQLRGEETNTKLPIKEITTFFRYCRSGMEFHGLKAHIGESIIRDTLHFQFRRPAEMGDFNNKVKIYAHLDSSIIRFKDLGVFVPSVRKYKETLLISGRLKGKVTKFRVEQLDLAFGKHSRAIGKYSMEGFPNLEESFVDIDLHKSAVHIDDIRQYLPNEDTYRRLSKFGKLRFDARFTGFFTDFVTFGKFNTDLGFVDADINIKTKDNFYKGKIITKEFDLGTFLNIPDLVQKIDLSGSITGNNFTTEDAHFQLNAIISKFGFKQYNYKNIKVNAHLEHKFFEGDVSIKDTNFVFDGHGQINLKDSTLNFQANLDSAFLHKINWVSEKDYLFVKGKSYLNFAGLDWDKLEGTIDLQDAFVQYNKESLPLKNLFIRSHKEGKVRDFDLVCDYFDFKADGEFELTRFFNDVKALAEEYRLHFENNKKNLDDYYIKKPFLDFAMYEKLSYRLEYDLLLKDITPVARLFDKKIYVSKKSQINGFFNSDYEKKFSLDGYIDSLFYGDYRFYDNNFNLSTYKAEDERKVFLEANILSEKQKISNLFLTEKFNISADWDDHKIHFRSFIKEQGTINKADLQGSLEFTGNRSYELKVHPSEIVAMYETWCNFDTLQINIDKQDIDFHTIYFENGNKKVWVIGQISEDLQKYLQLKVRNFDLNLFSPYIGKNLSGSINGEAFLRNLYHTPMVEGEIDVLNISMDKVQYGNLHINSAWQDIEQRLAIHAKLQTPEHFEYDEPFLKIDGFYNVKNKVSPLELNAELRKTPVKLIEPFLSAVASEFEGVATGDIAITGKPAYPQLQGEVFVSDGKFKVNYLNTYYRFHDFIYLEPDHIGMKQLKLLDANNNRAIVNGGIYHDGFRNFLMQLSLDFYKFQVLNTQMTDEALYFGTAYGTGKLDILGTTDNLEVNVTGRTEEGTKLYFAMDSYSGVQEKEFIRFVDFKKDSLLLKQNKKVDLSGIKLNFNLELTPDAYGEIIFDKRSGDIIRGNTLGKINMLIDTKGDFKMYGDVEFVRGKYTFTFLNVVSKEFDILQGSRVGWTGDPFGGQLDVKAAYKLRTSLAPIMLLTDSASRNLPEVRRAYPVKVDMSVRGALFSPEIKFDIDMAEYPAMISAGGVAIPLETYVQAFKAKIAANEQELNRQVFSLMVLNRLSSENAFASANGQAVTSSVSELLTNQLSHWMSQVDENLQIDLNLNGLTADALNTFQMRVSYSFLNGRMRITRSGGFTSVNNRASATAVIGDWTVEYLLTQDAKLRVKAYYKSVTNTFSTDLNNIGASGMGMSYTHSFSRFSELLPRLRKSKRLKKDSKVIEYRDDEIR